MVLGVPWLAILLPSVVFVATSLPETCPSSQPCTEGTTVDTCAPGEGGWYCGQDTWVADETFNAITDGACTQNDDSTFLCGKHRVQRIVHDATLTGRCVRECKKYSTVKACDSPQCALDSFSCSFKNETIELKADMFHTLHSSTCFVQRHPRTRRESIVCASSLGEVKTSIETYMAATRGDCTYICSHEAPKKLDSCASTASAPDEDEREVPVIKKDHPSKLPMTKRGEIQTIKTPFLSTPSLVEEPQNTSTDSDRPTGIESRPTKSETIPDADVEPTIEVPSEERAPVQTIEGEIEESSTETAQTDVDTGGIAKAGQDREPTVVKLTPNTSDALDLEPAPLEARIPSQTARTTYTTGAWQDCSVACGVGVQERSVACVMSDDTDQSVSIDICRGNPDLGPTPASTRRCIRPPCEEFTAIVTGTDECSNTCGPSLERQSLICASNYGRTVSLEKCGLTMPKIGSLFGKKISFESKILVGGQKGCDKEVNMGVKKFLEMSRKSSIINEERLSKTQCQNTFVIEGALVEKCEAIDCGNRVWTVTKEWSECTKTCGGGVQTREVKCYQNGREVADSRCPAPKPIAKRACNTSKCQEDLAYWMAGSWSECDKECMEEHDNEKEIRYGRRYRDVSCVSVSKKVLDDSACSSIQKPASQSTCAVKRCDFCDVEQPCNGRGTCENLSCECWDGFGGERCEYKAACDSGDDDCCPTTVVDDAGKCCASGVVGKDGQCCDAGQVLDGDGYCCAGALDACGVCGGAAIQVDALGECCDGQVDASGICCMGLVDECGVCDGSGMSCDTSLRIAAAVEPSIRREIKQNIKGIQSALLKQKVMNQISSHLGIDKSFLHVQRLLGESVPKTTRRGLLDNSDGNNKVATNTAITWMKNLVEATREAVRPASVPARLSAAPWFDTTPPPIPLPRRNRKIKQLAKQDSEEKRGAATTKRVLLQAGGPTPKKPPQNPNVGSSVTVDGKAGLSLSQLHNSLMGLEGDVKVLTEDKVGVCGNGICELDERPVMNGEESDGCPLDCMVPLIHPPSTEIQGRSVHCSGRGKPLFVSGTCQCFAGHSGDACELCKPGFIRVAGAEPGEFQCTQNFSPSVPLLNDEATSDLLNTKAPNKGSSSGSSKDITDTKRKSAKAGPTTLALIGCLVAVAVLGALAAVVLFLRRKREETESRQDREIPVISQPEPDLESGLPPKEAEGRYRHGGIPDHITFITPPRTNSTASGSGDEAAISIEEAVMGDIPEPSAGPQPFSLSF
ncbi:hypothetical protein BSKO_11401 [Bryopsis sp. KO-2023]|nr:hypothetical protein BSKO_11401 [Bryopsis sp. KO-2023]